MKISELVRSNIKTLKPYSSARDEFSGAEGIFLDARAGRYDFFDRLRVVTSCSVVLSDSRRHDKGTKNQRE